MLSWLTSLVHGDTSIPWLTLEQLLTAAPALEFLKVKVDDRGTSPKFGKTYNQLKSLDITIDTGGYGNTGNGHEMLPKLMAVLGGLNQLKVDVKSKAGHAIWHSKDHETRLDVTDLEIRGPGMTHRVLLGILSACPRVTRLSAACDESEHLASEYSMHRLGALCDRASSLEELNLDDYNEDGFELLPAIDLIAAKLLHLRKLSLPIVLLSLSAHDLSSLRKTVRDGQRSILWNSASPAMIGTTNRRASCPPTFSLLWYERIRAFVESSTTPDPIGEIDRMASSGGMILSTPSKPSDNIFHGPISSLPTRPPGGSCIPNPMLHPNFRQP